MFNFNLKFSFIFFKSSTKWSKQCVCKCLVDKHFDTWVEAHLKLSTASAMERDAGENVRTLFVYYSLNNEFKEWSMDIVNISCFYQLRHASRPYTLSILAYDEVADCSGDNNIQQKVVLHFENEKLLREWMTLLSTSSTKMTTSQQMTSPSVIDACAETQTIATSYLGECVHL